MSSKTKENYVEFLASKSRMKLYEAINAVLRQTNRAMTTEEIAKELNKNNWYCNIDGSQVTASQIRMSVLNKEDFFLFEKNNNVVSLNLAGLKQREEEVIKKKRKKERNWSWDDFFEIINPENWGCGTKIALIVITLIIGVVVGMCRDGTIGNSGSSCSRSSSSSSKVQNSPYDASVHQVKSYLKRTLKDPSSYEKIEWGPVVEASGNEGYKYMVRHKYRAKNSYGGYVVEHQIFYLDSQGNILWYEDIY